MNVSKSIHVVGAFGIRVISMQEETFKRSHNKRTASVTKSVPTNNTRRFLANISNWKLFRKITNGSPFSFLPLNYVADF